MRATTLWVLIVVPQALFADDNKRSSRQTKRAVKKAARLDRSEGRKKTRDPIEKAPAYEYDALPGRVPSEVLTASAKQDVSKSKVNVQSGDVSNLENAGGVSRFTDPVPSFAPLIARRQLPSAQSRPDNDSGRKQSTLDSNDTSNRSLDTYKPTFYGYLGKPRLRRGTTDAGDPGRRLQSIDDDDSFIMYDATAPGEIGGDYGGANGRSEDIQMNELATSTFAPYTTSSSYLSTSETDFLSFPSSTDWGTWTGVSGSTYALETEETSSTFHTMESSESPTTFPDTTSLDGFSSTMDHTLMTSMQWWSTESTTFDAWDFITTSEEDLPTTSTPQWTATSDDESTTRDDSTVGLSTIESTSDWSFDPQISSTRISTESTDDMSYSTTLPESTLAQTTETESWPSTTPEDFTSFESTSHAESTSIDEVTTSSATILFSSTESEDAEFSTSSATIAYSNNPSSSATEEASTFADGDEEITSSTTFPTATTEDDMGLLSFSTTADADPKDESTEVTTTVDTEEAEDATTLPFVTKSDITDASESTGDEDDEDAEDDDEDDEDDSTSTPFPVLSSMTDFTLEPLGITSSPLFTSKITEWESTSEFASKVTEWESTSGELDSDSFSSTTESPFTFSEDVEWTDVSTTSSYAFAGDSTTEPSEAPTSFPPDSTSIRSDGYTSEWTSTEWTSSADRLATVGVYGSTSDLSTLSANDFTSFDGMSTSSEQTSESPFGESTDWSTTSENTGTAENTVHTASTTLTEDTTLPSSTSTDYDSSYTIRQLHTSTEYESDHTRPFQVSSEGFATSTDWSTSSGFEETTLSQVDTSERPLDFLPYKSISGLFPLEVMVRESDLSILGGAIQANEKYDTLRKVGMTIFAPVNAAFQGLPVDLESLQGQNGGDLLRRRGGRDGDSDLARQIIDNRNLRSSPQSPYNFGRHLTARADPDDNNRTEEIAPSRNLGRFNCDPYEGYPCATANSYLIPPSHSGILQAQRVKAQKKNIMEDFEKLVMYHVVKRIVPPGMIEAKRLLEQRTEMKGRQLKIELITLMDGSREVQVGDGQARVLEIIHCRNGFIYKIDRPLFPPWNVGAPNLLEFIASSPKYTRLRYLMEQSGMFTKWSLAGPVTMLLIPDNAWRLDGLQVPPCFFKALVRPENAEILSKLLRWTTIPGLWTKDDIQNVDWLPNGAAPSLSVTTIDMPTWQESQRVRSEAYDKKRRQATDVGIAEPQWLFDVEGSSEYAEYEDGDWNEPVHIPVVHAADGKVTLIEGKEVVAWDLPFYNGFGHAISELPIRPDLDLRGMLWDCMDMFCGECPIVTKFLLKYLDGGGLLPDVTNPKAYVVPPGVRPAWMCSTARHWFPPGWDYNEWYRYLDYARAGNHKLAHTTAVGGWKKASVKNAELIDKLQEAEIHLRQLYRTYGNPNEYVLGEKDDPSLLIGWLKNKRSLEFKPKICDPKTLKHPGVLLDSEDPWEGGDPWGASMVSGPRAAFYEAMDRDRMRRFGMEDLRYVSQWI